MRFYRNLYVSDGYRKKKEELVQRMKRGKYPFSAYLLVLIEDGPNQIEFYSTAMLYQEYCRPDYIYVIGIAESYMDAVYMVEDITREVYEKTGTADIRSYIRAQEIQPSENEM